MHLLKLGKNKNLDKIFILFVLLFLIVNFSTCHKPQDKNLIEFWTLQLSPTFDSYFHNLIQKYESLNPNVKIRWVDVPYDAVIQKLMAAISSGKPPDVVNLSADFVSKFAQMEAFVDISSIIPKDSLKIYLPNALKNCVYDNKVVALPWYLNTYVLIYNKALLKQAGFSKNDIPKTFSDFVSFIKKYKNKTGKFATFWNIGKDSYLPMMLASEGIPMIDVERNRAVFNSPKAVELISMWVDLYREGYLPSESIIKPGSTIIEPYQSGQVAMVFTGPVFLKRVKDNAPKIYDETEISTAIVGITGKHELATMVISILATTKHTQEAVDFSLFVTNAENQLEFSKLARTIYPSVAKALEDSFFTIDDGTLESRARKIGAEELYSAERLNTYLEHPKFDELRDAFDEAIQNACLGKMSTKEALDKAAEEWNKILIEW
ncbi:MAG: sugar ABC transporter substrate-binding protein [Ignavibacteria bacterium]|nr:sugar ABC transporter substrate-binding protein [Ignavibacteria bacterium]